MKHEKKRSKSRVVGYAYEGTFDESVMEVLLRRALGDGVVAEFDAGRGNIVWFNGHPGEELREVRENVEAILTLTGHAWKQVVHPKS